MKELFTTFTPKLDVLQEYIDYYYLDLDTENTSRKFICFPHFNNTISLYKSHFRSENNEITYDENSSSLQIFTPIRKEVLEVKQAGSVHRVVIVFHPLGIQQFFPDFQATKLTDNEVFFDEQELNTIFSETDPEALNEILDRSFEKRITYHENARVQQLVAAIFANTEYFSVQAISNELGISRQHLNRIFKQQLGVSIKMFHKIVLFRKTVKRRLSEKDEKSLTELAHEFNFNDQSHFIKTYKQLTFHAPNSFFKKGKLMGDEDTFWHT